MSRHTVTLDWVRIRVYQLARELGVSPRRVLAEVQRADGQAISASSLLDARVAAAVRSAVSSSLSRPTSPNPFTSNDAGWPRGTTNDTRPPSPGNWWDDDDWDDDPPLPDDAQLTVAEAARELGVRQATIRQWVHRGYLAASGARGRAQLYERGDLQRAKARAQSKTLRPAPPFAVPPALTRRPITTHEAAEIAGVSPSTIRMWVHRGLLRPLTMAGHGHKFDPIAVLRIARRR